jgi:hypothetical protein
MSALKKHSLAVALIAAYSTPSFAFLDGLTSVTNNLIDSTESVTNNTVNNATTTVLSLSSNPGKMADRIGQMADRIGYMGDRIVTTEGIVAGVAHKMLDTTKPQQPAMQQQAWGYAPAPSLYHAPANYQSHAGGIGYAQPLPVQHVQVNPYLPQSYTPQAVAPVSGYGYARPGNERYSASNMIFGVSGATYTAQRIPMPSVAQTYPTANKASPFGFAAQPVPTKVSVNCDFTYGVPVNCR